MSEETQDPGAGRWSAAQMLMELGLPIASARPTHAAIQQEFVAVVDPAIDLVMGAHPTTTGESQFAVRQLLVRAINDVVAAFHLATHGYLNQAYNAMRMAYEACDIIELVARDPEEGRLWVNSEKPWSDFAPGNVRERLGKDRVDELYSHLSEMAHPRFVAARLTGFGRRSPNADGTTSEELLLHLGAFPLDGHPAFLFTVAFVTNTTALVVLRTSHLAATGAVSESAWEQTVEQSMAAQQRLVALVSTGLADFGVDAIEVQRIYDERPRL